MIYDDGFELDSTGKAKICPKCENEEISEDGEFCEICGTVLVNKCSNIQGYNNEPPCGKIARGNARYCKYCGSTTTFYNSQLLKDWTIVMNQLKKAQEEIVTTIATLDDE